MISVPLVEIGTINVPQVEILSLPYVHRVSGTLLPRLSHRTGQSSSNSHRGGVDSISDRREVVQSKGVTRRSRLHCEIQAAHATDAWAANSRSFSRII